MPWNILCHSWKRKNDHTNTNIPTRTQLLKLLWGGKQNHQDEVTLLSLNLMFGLQKFPARLSGGCARQRSKHPFWQPLRLQHWAWTDWAADQMPWVKVTSCHLKCSKTNRINKFGPSYFERPRDASSDSFHCQERTWIPNGGGQRPTPWEENATDWGISIPQRSAKEYHWLYPIQKQITRWGKHAFDIIWCKI